MTISLLFGVHAHQPVGNFPAVIDDAHVRCYGMFLRVLDGYPEFRFSVHFSGWLLDVLRQRFPADMALLAKMTARGQVEWFGSGDCEPVLAAIPQRDRLSQIEILSTKLDRYFGQRPQGAWLTERVWESSVVPSLADSGIRYVAVDDYHFLCAGTEAATLDSFYTTEEDGRSLDLFPISEALRYRLPFSPAPEAVAFLEQMAREGKRAAIYFDDIEKFGIWPETYNWVYERGWLAQFIEGVLASPLIRATTFADYHAHSAFATRGIVYLPTTSYIEMNEWTLPSAAAREYAALVETEKAGGGYEQHKAFLRGGIWRNFLTRYPESNWMHKRMLGLSARLAVLPETAEGQQRRELQELLHRAQANDAYWHGLFGGLYLPHLRRAIWNNLLALEAALDLRLPRAAFERRDLDFDGREELVLHNPELQAIVRVDGNAAVLELSSYATAHNFGDSLRRYVENYHRKIAGAQHAAPEHAEGISSAHDRIAFKHPIEAVDALADGRPRAICIDTLIAGDGTRQAIDAYYEVTASAGGLVFATEIGGGRIEKRLLLDGPSLEVRYRGAGLLGSRIEIQMNLAMPSCDGFSGRYILADGSVPCGFGQPLEVVDLRRITLQDGELHGQLELLADRPLGLNAAPHFTVSQSEAGFEKIMQAACLTLSWVPDSNVDSLSLRFTVVPDTRLRAPVPQTQGRAPAPSIS